MIAIQHHHTHMCHHQHFALRWHLVTLVLELVTDHCGKTCALTLSAIASSLKIEAILADAAPIQAEQCRAYESADISHFTLTHYKHQQQQC